MYFFINLVEINFLFWFLLFGTLSGLNLIQMDGSGEGIKAEATKISVVPSVIKCDGVGRCICPPDPLTSRYPDPADPSCERYYLCHLGFGFLKKCDVRQAFHPGKNECVPRSQVPFQTCPTPVPCLTNGFVEDPVDCTKYYLCFYLQAYHYACNVEHYYDKVKEKCILNKMQTQICKEKAKIKPTTTTTTTTTINPLLLLENEIDEIEEA